MGGIFTTPFSDLRHPVGLLRRCVSRNDRLLIKGLRRLGGLRGRSPLAGDMTGVIPIAVEFHPQTHGQDARATSEPAV